jgi:hypothetical protein
MFTYKLKNNYDNVLVAILRFDGCGIPFDPDNTDYQAFKKEVLAGAELQDADGNVMTQEQADDFIKELP